MVLLLQVNLFLHLYGLYLLQLRLQVCLHFFLHSFLEANVEVRAIGEHALHQFSILALEEAQYGHSLLIVMLLIFVRPCLEVSQETQNVLIAFVESNAHLLFELLSLVTNSFSHGLAPNIQIYNLCLSQKNYNIFSHSPIRLLFSTIQQHSTTTLTSITSSRTNIKSYQNAQVIPFLLLRYWQIYLGMSNSTKNNSQFMQPPLYIDKYALLYLYLNKQVCEKERIVLKNLSEDITNNLDQLGKKEQSKVYLKLIRDYYLINGHKFGCAFLAYTKDPQIHHAQYLIFTGTQSENHMSRLSGIAKKIGWSVTTNGEEMVIRVIEQVNSRKKKE